jgi:hypothetical protein
MTDPMHTVDPARRDPTRISPELALVDPDLARRVRKWLPTGRTRPKPPLPALRRGSRAGVEASEATSPTP